MRFSVAVTNLCFLVLGLTIQCAAAEPVSGQSQPVTVMLVDGRLVSGQVAATSSPVQLDLVLTSGRAQVTTHVDWKDVATIMAAKREISVEAFRKQLANFKTPARLLQSVAEAASLPQPTEPPESGGSSPPVRMKNPDLTHEDHRKNIRLAHSIEFQTRLANWDNDAEPDGILLELFVLDNRGWSLHVPGQLSATLTGLRNQSTRGRIAIDGQPPTVRLERWEVRLRADQFDHGRSVIKLPFRRPDRNNELDVAPFGLIQISYSIPSVGVFRASQSDVLIQRSSFFRDELFLSTGNRYLPSERRPSRQQGQGLRGL